MLILIMKPGCAPCSSYGKLVKEVADRYRLPLRLVLFNSIDGRALARQYGIVMAPSVILEGDTPIVVQGKQTRDLLIQKLGL
jgi:thioredoxin-like negative regulator of GroEL